MKKLMKSTEIEIVGLAASVEGPRYKSDVPHLYDDIALDIISPNRDQIGVLMSIDGEKFFYCDDHLYGILENRDSYNINNAIGFVAWIEKPIAQNLKLIKKKIAKTYKKV